MDSGDQVKHTASFTAYPRSLFVDMIQSCPAPAATPLHGLPQAQQEAVQLGLHGHWEFSLWKGVLDVGLGLGTGCYHALVCGPLKTHSTAITGSSSVLFLTSQVTWEASIGQRHQGAELAPGKKATSTYSMEWGIAPQSPQEPESAGGH